MYDKLLAHEAIMMYDVRCLMYACPIIAEFPIISLSYIVHRTSYMATTLVNKLTIN